MLLYDTIHGFFTVPVYAIENVSLIYVSLRYETISIDNGTSMEQASDVAFLQAPWPYCMTAGSIPIELLLDETWNVKMGPLTVVMDLCAFFDWFLPSSESRSSVSIEAALITTLVALTCGNEQTYIVHAYPLPQTRQSEGTGDMNR